MKRRDLAGVNDRFAVKAHLADHRCFRDEALFIINVRIDGIKRHDAGGLRCVDDHAACEHQLDALGRTGGLEVGDVILRAECDADEALA